MGELIELIVRIILGAFGDRPSPPPPPRLPPLPAPAAPAPPIPGRPTKRPVPVRRPPPLSRNLNRPQKVSGKRRGQVAPPPLPPLPTLAKAPPAMPAPAVVQHRHSVISASGIGTLIRSRPAALRSIFVMSEVVRPPLALRQRQAELH